VRFSCLVTSPAASIADVFLRFDGHEGRSQEGDQLLLSAAFGKLPIGTARREARMERRSIGSLREIGVLFVALYLSAGVASIVLAVIAQRRFYGAYIDRYGDRRRCWQFWLMPDGSSRLWGRFWYRVLDDPLVERRRRQALLAWIPAFVLISIPIVFGLYEDSGATEAPRCGSCSSSAALSAGPTGGRGSVPSAIGCQVGGLDLHRLIRGWSRCLRPPHSCPLQVAQLMLPGRIFARKVGVEAPPLPSKCERPYS